MVKVNKRRLFGIHSSLPPTHIPLLYSTATPSDEQEVVFVPFPGSYTICSLPFNFSSQLPSHPNETRACLLFITQYDQKY